jgi:hypothetical protein
LGRTLIIVHGSVGGTFAAGLDRFVGTLARAVLGAPVAVAGEFWRVPQATPATGVVPVALLAAMRPSFGRAPRAPERPSSGAVTASWYGDSVGHYEGDTLVIDTVGIKTDRPYAMIDLFDTPYTKSLHLVERYRLREYDDVKDAIERNKKENWLSNDLLHRPSRQARAKNGGGRRSIAAGLRGRAERSRRHP